VAQEVLHSLKTRNMKGVVLKINLSNSYYRVNWNYIRLILTHIRFEVPFIIWVMSCLNSVSFVVLINRVASPFFDAEWGLQQGCSLSPLLFMLISEGLSWAMVEAKHLEDFKGIQISLNLIITHLHFLYDVLLFCDGSRRDMVKLIEILDQFCQATSMEVNGRKSFMSCYNLTNQEIEPYHNLFHFSLIEFETGFKYLGFHLKPNNYGKRNWIGLIAKLENRLSN
jgi:hypothetical protein